MWDDGIQQRVEILRRDAPPPPAATRRRSIHNPAAAFVPSGAAPARPVERASALRHGWILHRDPARSAWNTHPGTWRRHVDGPHRTVSSATASRCIGPSAARARRDSADERRGLAACYKTRPLRPAARHAPTRPRPHSALLLPPQAGKGADPPRCHQRVPPLGRRTHFLGLACQLADWRIGDWRLAIGDWRLVDWSIGRLVDWRNASADP